MDIRSFFNKQGTKNGSVKKTAATTLATVDKKPSRRRVVIDSDEDEITKQVVGSPNKKMKIEPLPNVEVSDYFGSRKKAHTVESKYIESDQDDDDDDTYKSETFDPMEDIVPVTTRRRNPRTATSEPVILSDDDAPIAPKTVAKAIKAPIKAEIKAEIIERPTKPTTPRKQADIVVSGVNAVDILAKIPNAELPTVDPNRPKMTFREIMALKQAAESSQSTASSSATEREIPEAAENCLVGMTFVFTGVLPTLSREKCKEIVQSLGGKVTTAPSGKTTCIVLGQDAGPSKIEKIQKLGIKTIDEDGFIQLLASMPANGGSGEAAQKAREKKEAEMRAIEEQAQREIAQELAEKKLKAKAAAAAEAARADEAAKLAKQLELTSQSSPQFVKSISTGLTPSILPKPAAYKEYTHDQTTEEELWTSKYAPKSFMQFSGNKTAVERLRTWLRNWDANQKSGFTHLGPDGSGKFRAVIMHGPPGIGKTTAAHLAAKEAGYDVIESNASDTRSKGLLADKVTGMLANTSINGFFAGAGQHVDKTKKKICVIMDEVDGMSSGDRGGVGQMAALCKTTQVPIILICNERRLPKMKPFDAVAFDINFRRLDVNQARARMMTIAIKEGIKIPANVLDNLIIATNSDLRQVINMLSTFARSQKDMDFNQSKDMGKAWEKNVILKPFDIASKLLAGSTFAPSSPMTLNDKIELYFHDHAFAPLMIQENYLSTAPARRDANHLTLVEHAADSLSESDLVDRMIHGSEQRWSLMPYHAIMSSVRPSSFVAGGLTGRMNFSAWLGQNSKGGKLTRLLQELQSHARLRISGDRHEVRLNYLPTWTRRLTQPLINEGQDGIPDVMEMMDEYFLTREDWDSIMELGVGPTSGEVAIKAIPTAVKSAFTRKYNAASHPVPFMKSGTTGAFSGGKLAANDTPDLEDVFEDDVDTPNDDERETPEDEDDITKDKYIKMGKKPAAKKAAVKKPAVKRKAAVKK